MTPQEQQLLQGLTDRVNRTTLTEKDPEAEQFLNQALGRNPDTVYILSQTVLVQQYALDEAKKQLDDLREQARQQAQLQQQTPAPQKHTSFLGNLLGMNEASAPPPPPQYAPVSSPGNAPPYPPPGYGQPQYAPPQYLQPGYSSGPFSGGGMGSGGGFLSGAMQTAAGVAAGALAFEGIEDLMHGFEHRAGYGLGSGLDGGFGGGQREEVVNNYYGGSGAQSGDHGDLSSRLEQADGGSNSISSDIEDRRGDARGFAETGDDNQNNFADTSNDDASGNDYQDDGSGSDDSGVDDNSGSDDSNGF
jgi:hypothetical protein